MANRYWVGGTGSWTPFDTTHWSTTSGGAGGASVPTSSDDVIFDSASNATGYVVTNVSGTANCLSLTLNAPATGTLTFSWNQRLNIFGDITLAASGVTFSGISGAVTMSATSGTKIITSNGASFPNLTLNGVGGTFQLADNLTITNGGLINTNGTFDANGKTLTLAPVSGWGNGITGSFTFYNLTLTGSAAKTLECILTSNITVSNNLVINGNSKINRILIKSSVVGTQRTITAASVSCNAVDFQDIVGAGAGSWNLSGVSNYSGDCGGNSGITFTTGATQTATGSVGFTWSTHGWTSRVPLPQDDVVINNAFGTSQTITADMPRLGKSVNFTGATFTTNLTINVSGGVIYGDYTLIAGMSSSNSVVTLSGRGSHTLTTAGVAWSNSLNITAFGGTYTLQDNLTITNTSVSLTLNNGTLDFNNFNVTLSGSFQSSVATVRTLNMGSGTMTLSNTGTTWNTATTTNLTLNSGTSLVVFSNATATALSPNFGGVVMNDVSVNASTGNLTLNGANIRHLNLTGYAGALQAATMTIRGNLTLGSGMTVSSAGNVTTFSNTSGTYTITTNGVTYSRPITIDGVGATWQLGSDFVTNQAITLTNGGFNANNYNVTCSIFASSNSNVRTLTMGSGTWIMNSATAPTSWNTGTVTNLTFNANTSTIKFSVTSGSVLTFAGGGLTFNNFWFSNASTGYLNITGSNTFNDFKCDTPSQTIGFTAGTTTTVTTFSVNGTAGNLITIYSAGNSLSTHSLVKAGGGTISCDYLNIQHSVVTPANTWYAGTNSTNNQAVATAGSGWSFTSPPTPKYWVGGSATWDATAGSKWSLTSGGAGGASAPTSGEDAIFDANSGAVTISTTGMTTITCKNLVFTGFTGTFGSNASTNLEIYGDMTLVSGMTTAFTNMNFKFKGTGNLTSAGKTLPSLLFDGVGATFTLQDAMVSTQTGTVNQLTNGTLNLNNQNLTVDNFESSNSNTRTLTLGSGTITLTGTGNVWNITTATNLTLNANTSTIKITNTSSTARSFIGGGKTYNNFWNAAGASSATLTIAGSNTFADFKDDGTVAHSILFTAGTTQTVTTFTVNGTFAQLITLDSTTTGTYTLTKAGGGTITCDYLNIQHCVATPSSTWYANSHCVNNQAVVTAGSGWTFASTTDISLVAHTVASGTTSSVTTSAIDTSGATLIVVAVATDSAAGAGTLTDSKGNTWTALAAQTASANSRHQLFYCVNPTVGSGHTFTNSGATNYPSIAVAAFDRTLNTTAFDVSDGNGTASPTTSLVVDSITPTFNLELIVTGFASDVTTALAINSSMTIIDQLGYSAGVNMGVGLAYKVLAVAAATSPTLSWTGSKSVAASSAAFKSYLNTSGTPTSGKFFPFFRA